MKLKFDNLNTMTENCLPTLTWLYKRYVRKRPDWFPYVEQNGNGYLITDETIKQIEKTGEPISFNYPPVHDVLDYAIAWKITHARHSGLDTNGFELVNNEVDHDKFNGSAVIQPVKIYRK